MVFGLTYGVLMRWLGCCCLGLEFVVVFVALRGLWWVLLRGLVCYERIWLCCGFRCLVCVSLGLAWSVSFMICLGWVLLWLLLCCLDWCVVGFGMLVGVNSVVISS